MGRRHKITTTKTVHQVGRGCDRLARIVDQPVRGTHGNGGRGRLKLRNSDPGNHEFERTYNWPSRALPQIDACGAMLILENAKNARTTANHVDA